MTDYDELKARLRDRTIFGTATTEQAADAITALQARVAEEEGWVEMLRDERDELLRQRNAAMTRAEAAEARVASLETESQAMVAAVLEAAAKRCEDDVPNWAKSCGQRGPGNDFADMIRALTPADAKAAHDRLIAEAVAAETERCAEVVEDYAKDPNCIDGRGDFWAKSIAETIRGDRT